jgi:hypothetical protein
MYILQAELETIKKLSLAMSADLSSTLPTPTKRGGGGDSGSDSDDNATSDSGDSSGEEAIDAITLIMKADAAKKR